MAILGVDDMKAKLVGGGARPNLFKVTMAFPSYVTANVELASYMCKATSMPSSTIAPIAGPFRGRQLQIAGDRTFDPWSVTIINDTDFKNYHGIIEAAYRFHDMMLGRLIALAGTDATIMLVSDHGFHPDHLRRRKVTFELAGPSQEHSQYGIICATGAGIKKDEIVPQPIQELNKEITSFLMRLNILFENWLLPFDYCCND